MGTEYVVTGGGPVGLWTAIQIKKRQPDADITVYERYQEYKRSHVLKLENLSMLLYAKQSGDAHEQRFFDAVVGSSLKKAFWGAAGGKSVFIRTNALESALKQYARALDIPICYERINSPETLITKHPNCTNFIAADGAHSALRQALMGDDAVKNFPLQYVVELKYEAQGAAKALSNRAQYKTNKLLSSMAFEYVGKEKNGQAPVSLRFFVDEATYNAMPEASFKEPLTLKDPRLPQNFADDLATYLSVRANKAKEQFIDGSEKISKLTLSLYRANKFAVQHEDRNWYLVGDAAMGVPYFRSLNAGMMIGSQLSYIVTQDNWAQSTKINTYNACRPLDVAWEFTAASLKNAALCGYNQFRKVSAKVPWEFMKWDSEERNNFKKLGPK
ncbi:MAG: hypothetical protein VYC19_10700 [Pseudomonadota bacterium]|nr:hypothetical protein [Pseudomonadota bacterium]MEC9236268.1 hypothetical protein [Pseudomonadota bacterium]